MLDEKQKHLNRIKKIFYSKSPSLTVETNHEPLNKLVQGLHRKATFMFSNQQEKLSETRYIVDRLVDDLKMVQKQQHRQLDARLATLQSDYQCHIELLEREYQQRVQDANRDWQEQMQFEKQKCEERIQQKARMLEESLEDSVLVDKELYVGSNGIYEHQGRTPRWRSETKSNDVASPPRCSVKWQPCSSSRLSPRVEMNGLESPLSKARRKVKVLETRLASFSFK